MTSPKKIAIIHYRVGGTDGVSLEIDKRKDILEQHGYNVRLIAGPRSKGADYTIKELEWDDGFIPIIKENGFVHFKRNDLTVKELSAKMTKVARAIETRLNQIQKKEKFDHCLVHNVFSFGGHIAAAKAIAKWVEKNKLPCLATHHDFYWERKEYLTPRNQYLRHYLYKYMPPHSDLVKHVVINSIAQKVLKKRTKLNSQVMPDVFDFKQSPWTKDKFNQKFLQDFHIKPNDLIVLQATRVIPRKGIELAIDYAKVLQANIEKLRGKTLYNGKKLNSRSNVILIVAGYAEDEKRDYLFKLKSKAFDEKVRAFFIGDYVHAKRKFSQGQKTYSLWDAYVYSDLITFPSIWEGWGNQFIEGIFAQKPIVLNKYPVYKQDIEQEGYHVISLNQNGNKIKMNENELYYLPPEDIEHAVKETIKWLTHDITNKKLANNFKIGEKYHGYQVLEKFLLDNISN